MDIRTKLALALVATALLSMALLGVFAYRASVQLLNQISERQLDALAESKKNDLINVLDGWRDSVRLMRSRTQLRLNLEQFTRTREQRLQQHIQRIIADAKDSVRAVRRITLYARDGELVAQAGTAPEPAEMRPVEDLEAVRYAGTHVHDTGVGVTFYSAMSLAGVELGQLEVVFDALEIKPITENYTGLGDTGESLVVKARNGEYLLLNHTRHESAYPQRGFMSNASPQIARALAGVEGISSDETDYRGEPVIAATRYLGEVDWGLVVKIDHADEAKRANELFDLLRDVALALSAFAVVGGTLLGIYLARPIRELAEVVSRIRAGERELRAAVKGEDEVAYLAACVNEFMDGAQRPDQDQPRV